MLTLTRLTVARQRRVAESLKEVAADKATVKSLSAEVRSQLDEVVTIGAHLDAVRELPALVLDNTADVVYGSFSYFLDAIDRGLDDRVIKPLAPEQARKKAAAATLEQRAFPDGIGFLALSMPLQYDGMRACVDTLTKDHACVDAVKELGCKWFVDHLEAHLAPYGRAVRTADNRDLEAESDAFHAGFTKLAILVSAHHASDGAIQKQLLGAYETELAAQREEERASRARSRKKKAAAANA